MRRGRQIPILAWNATPVCSINDSLQPNLPRAALDEVRSRFLRSKARAGIQFNDHCDDLPAAVVFRHACKLGFEGIVSKRLGSPYRSGRSRDWLKTKNPNAPAVKREAEEDWGRDRWR